MYGIHEMAVENKQIAKLNNQADSFRRLSLLTTSLSALKIQAYRIRLVNYLQHKKLLTKLAPKFFENLKDKYYDKQTNRANKSKAVRFYHQRMSFFTIKKI